MIHKVMYVGLSSCNTKHSLAPQHSLTLKLDIRVLKPAKLITENVTSIFDKA